MIVYVKYHPMNAWFQETQFIWLHLIARGIEALPVALVVLAILFLTYYAANVTRRMATIALEQMTKSQALQSLLVLTIYVAVWVGGILLASVIAFPSWRLGDIIGLLGLSLITISLAFQDILKNFLAGVLLLLNKSFHLGEQVIVNGFEGTIEEINIRSTQIRTCQGELIVIPNAIMFTSPVRIVTAMPHRRTDLALGIDYNTDLSDTIQILLTTLATAEGVLSNPAPEVDVVSFGECWINLRIRFWTLSQAVQVRQTQTRVLIALTKTCAQAKIFIPYQIRLL